MLIPIWFTIGLLSVFVGVIGSFFDKYLLKKYFGNDSGDGAGALIIFSSFFLLFLLPLLGFVGYGKITLDIEIGYVGLISGVLSCLWILLYLHALSEVDVSQAIPVFQIIPVFGLILGYLFFGEVLSITQIISAGIILFGAHLLLSNKKQTEKVGVNKVLILMLCASFVVALSQVIFKVVAVDIDFWTAIFWNWVGFICFGLVLYVFVQPYRLQFKVFIKQRTASLRTIYGVSAINEVFDILSDILLLAAVVLDPIGLVQSINAYEPVLVLLLGFVLVKTAPKYFQGDFTKLSLTQKILGVFVITIGSILLYTTF